MLVNCYYHLDLIFTMISTINGKALEVNNAQILFVIGIFTFILTFFLPGNGHFVLGSITGFWIALVYIFFSKYEDGQFNQILPETMNLTSLKFIYTDLWWITLACALVFFIAAGINDFNETSSSENKVEENKQNKQSKKKLTIKIQENKLNKSLQELDYLIGLSNVKQFMKELVNDALLFSERAKKGQSISDMSYHMIFLGPPGQERQRLLE
ncbi:hypothetical protein J2Y02_005148 [Neobacillus drentensis]|nr:hypothetical protein [Neobacillus drentensis]